MKDKKDIKYDPSSIYVGKVIITSSFVEDHYFDHIRPFINKKKYFLATKREESSHYKYFIMDKKSSIKEEELFEDLTQEKGDTNGSELAPYDIGFLPINSFSELTDKKELSYKDLNSVLKAFRNKHTDVSISEIYVGIFLEELIKNSKKMALKKSKKAILNFAAGAALLTSGIRIAIKNTDSNELNITKLSMALLFGFAYIFIRNGFRNSVLVSDDNFRLRAFKREARFREKRYSKKLIRSRNF